MHMPVALKASLYYVLVDVYLLSKYAHLLRGKKGKDFAP